VELIYILLALSVDPNNGFLELKSDIYRAVFEEFKKNDIEIPYPHRVSITKN